MNDAFMFYNRHCGCWSSVPVVQGTKLYRCISIESRMVRVRISLKFQLLHSSTNPDLRAASGGYKLFIINTTKTGYVDPLIR